MTPAGRYLTDPELHVFGRTVPSPTGSRQARINARVGDRYLRLSPSIFNDQADVGRVVEALA